MELKTVKVPVSLWWLLLGLLVLAGGIYFLWPNTAENTADKPPEPVAEVSTVPEAPEPAAEADTATLEGSRQVIAYMEAQDSAALLLKHRKTHCQALMREFLGYASATESAALETARRNMALISREMLNGYRPREGALPAESAATPDIQTVAGISGLRTARQGLLEALREAGQQQPAEAVVSIQNQCAACHRQYRADGGAGVPLPQYKLPMNAAQSGE